MKNLAKLSIIRDLLFTYSVENTKDLCREEIIVSKKINNIEEPSELFDALTKPEFTSYTKDDRDWLIKTLEYHPSINDNSDDVFHLFDT